MKLLIDANLSFRLARKLDGVFEQTLHVSRTPLPEPASDHQIWQWARENGFMLILSNDSDFEEIARLRGHPPKILLLKTGNQSTNFVADLLKRKIATIATFAASKEHSVLEFFDLTD